MTGETTRRNKRRRVRDREDPQDAPPSSEVEPPAEQPTTRKKKTPKTKAKSKSKSKYWQQNDDTLVNDTITPVVLKSRRRAATAGISTKKFPPIAETAFGLLQEKLWREPFWLLVAVTFLNKTAGRSAAPVFWRLKELYPRPADLAAADEQELIELIRHLGLQTQRARRLVKIASAWVAEEPCKGRQYRTLHYPVKNDGKGFKKEELVELDAPVCAGLLEIGKIPGCGPYAWDSWRIFCRDVLRGVADDYNGLNAATAMSNGKSTSNADDGDKHVPERETPFEPEWKRVLPLDKELRAYLRWMWLREGFIWNHETGERRGVTDDEREAAIRGELQAADDDEAYFTAQAREDVYDGAEGKADAVAEHESIEDNAQHGKIAKSTRRSSRKIRRHS